MTYFLTVMGYILTTIYFSIGLSAFGLMVTERYERKRHIQHASILTATNLFAYTMCGVLHMGLFVNWIVFGIVNYIEFRLLLKVSKQKALFFSFTICLVGLSSNLFYRALLTSILNKPLSYFDSATQSWEYSTVYPVMLSFLSSGTIFLICARERFSQKLRYVLKALHHLRYLMVTMAILITYLMAQFLLYSSETNNLPAKIWSLAACLYVSFGYSCILFFALKMSYLYHLDQENKVMQTKLRSFMSEERSLRRATDLDTTTGVCSRGVGDDFFRKFMQEYTSFQVSLIDLDGLKYVNDHYGHEAGDAYLKTVADHLKDICIKGRDLVYRYGGDEFILLYLDQDRSLLAEQLRVCGSKLQKRPEVHGMQISFGIVTYTGEETMEQLIEVADQQMYEMKHRHKKEQPERYR